MRSLKIFIGFLLLYTAVSFYFIRHIPTTDEPPVEAPNEWHPEAPATIVEHVVSDSPPLPVPQTPSLQDVIAKMTQRPPASLSRGDQAAAAARQYIAQARQGIPNLRKPGSWEGEAAWVPPPNPPLLVPNDFQLDVLFTWVDGTQADHIAKRKQFIPNKHEESLDLRYENHDELRYGFRSVEQFLPYVRKVFLLTDHQMPPWLNKEHPKLRLINHEDVFSDVSVLPTFNAFAIESQMLRFPELGEKILYFNDDMFVGRFMQPAELYNENGTVVFIEPDLKVTNKRPGAPRRPMSEWDALAYTSELLDARFGVRTRAYVSHVPHMLDKPLYEEIAATWPEQLASTAAHRIRTKEKIADVHMPFLHTQFLMERYREERFYGIVQFFVDADQDGMLGPNDIKNIMALCAERGVTPFLQLVALEQPLTLQEVLVRYPLLTDGLLGLFPEWPPANLDGPWSRYKYIIGNKELAFVNIRKGSDFKKTLERIWQHHPAFFCINDDEKRDRKFADATIKTFLSKYFPKPSSFELPPPQEVVSKI